MESAQKCPDIHVCGVQVSLLESYTHAEQVIVQRIKTKAKTFCVAVNPEKIYRSQKDPQIKELINSANVHICDGVGAAIAARMLYSKKVGRITGVQLFLDLLAVAEKEGLSCFLLGASPDSNEGACQRLKQKYPKLHIAGSQHGYFESDEEVVRAINESKADMLFVAMGSPKQEEWILKHRDEIEVSYCMGVGGTFDVMSGKAKWAPKFFRRTGTEWLYRLIRQPSRIKRHGALAKYVLLVFRRSFWVRVARKWRGLCENP